MKADGTLERKVSVWNVWLHPRRAARRMEETEAIRQDCARKDGQIESLRDEVALQRDTISLLETEIHALKSTEVDFRAKYNALRNQLNIATGKIADLQKEIAAHVDFDAAIARLENQLAQTEKMKHGFETRIAILNLKIEEAQRRLRQAGLRSDFLADPRPIQMDSDNTLYPTPPSSQKPKTENQKPKTENQKPKTENQKPKPKDPTIWLRDIPENI